MAPRPHDKTPEPPVLPRCALAGLLGALLIPAADASPVRVDFSERACPSAAAEVEATIVQALESSDAMRDLDVTSKVSAAGGGARWALTLNGGGAPYAITADLSAECLAPIQDLGERYPCASGEGACFTVSPRGTAIYVTNRRGFARFADLLGW